MQNELRLFVRFLTRVV